MNDLVDFAIAAHGGMERFRAFTHLNARLHQGGILWGLKSKPTVLEDAGVTVNLRRQWVSHGPFAPTTNRSEYTPDRAAIVSDRGDLVEELLEPRKSFAGYELETPWSDPQVAYFAGYTMWTYLTTPFIFRQPGVETHELDTWSETGETWRRLRVVFPDAIATHCKVQTFYFDRDGLLRRHDYDVDIQGSNPAARYTSEPVQVEGITLYSKMRIYPRNADNTSASEPLIVSIDLTDYRYE